MDNTDVKAIWQSDKEDEGFNYSEQSIKKILEQGSSNIIAKFIKMLQFEQRLNLTVLTALPLYCIYEGSFKVTLIAFVVDGLLYWYYQRLIQMLKKEKIDSDVLRYLKDVHCLIKRFLLHLKLAVFPLSILAILATSFVFNIPLTAFYINESMSRGRGIFMIATMLSSILLAFFVIHIMYGKKAKRIKEMIDGLDQQE